MKKAKRSELKKKFGIDLPPGKYRVYTRDTEYEIYSVKDDTEGCILVGDAPDYNGSWLGDSRKAFNRIFPLIQGAFAGNEEIWLEIV